MSGVSWMPPAFYAILPPTAQGGPGLAGLFPPKVTTYVTERFEMKTEWFWNSAAQSDGRNISASPMYTFSGFHWPYRRRLRSSPPQTRSVADYWVATGRVATFRDHFAPAATWPCHAFAPSRGNSHRVAFSRLSVILHASSRQFSAIPGISRHFFIRGDRSLAFVPSMLSPLPVRLSSFHPDTTAGKMRLYHKKK